MDTKWPRGRLRPPLPYAPLPEPAAHHRATTGAVRRTGARSVGSSRLHRKVTAGMRRDSMHHRHRERICWSAGATAARLGYGSIASTRASQPSLLQ